MGKLDDLIAIERAEVGTRETGQNYVKYNDWYWGQGVGGPDYSWCVVFQAWCAEKAGVPFPHAAHCNQVESYAKAHEQWVTGPYRVGDYVIFDYNVDGNRDHIGFVVGVSGGRLLTIEGNYMDKVSDVVRDGVGIVGAYRPEYGEDVDTEEEQNQKQDYDPNTILNMFPVLQAGMIDPAVGALESLLRLRGYKMANSFVTIEQPDNEFGPECEEAVMDYTGKKYVDAAAWAKLIEG